MRSTPHRRRIFGVRGGILLHGFGGSVVGDYPSMRRWQRVVFYSMGPLFSLLHNFYLTLLAALL